MQEPAPTAREQLGWEDLARAMKQGETVEGVVLRQIKGGLEVDIGVTAFVPGSQIALGPQKDLDVFIGETLAFKIIKMNRERESIVLSRRVLLEAERNAERKETLANLVVGSTVSGVVKNVTVYGAYVDIGGIDGLLDVADMSHSPINHPSDLLQVGQTIEVKVLGYNEKNERVSLGLKQLALD